jgi:N6-adenosine-specific RNA methylase IME4
MMLPPSKKITVPARLCRELSVFRRQLHNADTAEKAMKVEVGVSALENAMRKAGFGEIEAIRPVREMFLDSRWTLGRLLAKAVRGHGPGRGRKGVGNADTFLPAGLKRDAAMEAQRIGTLPPKEKEKAYRQAKEDEVLPTISLLIDVARPYWYQASRKAKHRAIKQNAADLEEILGPFPLIYADPPWKFEIYSEKGAERTADQHYPTLDDDELAAFEVQGQLVREIAHDDAALFLWCTSSNLKRAIKLMERWDFEFKSSAVWVKTKEDGTPWSGLGLVFRNAHELLLYGTRGKMPGPQYQPCSVFMCQRGAHSAKPPEIRAAIEKMYPDFDRRTRLDLFSRCQSDDDWTSYGYEALSHAAE